MSHPEWLSATVILLVATFLSPSATGSEPSPKMTYPETKTVEQTDLLHGVTVPDPYRWLEADVRESEEVADWVERQNAITFGYLKAIPERDRIRERLETLWNYEKFGSPFRRGGRVYFYRNSGLQNQYVLMMETADGEPEILIDPNTWSDDGTIALAGTAFSDNGRYVAYGVQESGSDWRTWRIMEIATRRVLDDEIKRVKFSSVVWNGDGTELYYGRYPESETEEKFQSLNLGHQIYRHRLGTPQSNDVLIYENPDEPEWTFNPEVTEDGNYLLISIGKGTDDRNRLMVKNLKTDGELTTLVDNFDHEYSFIANEGNRFYFLTDRDAPNKRLVATEITDGLLGKLTEIIPESSDVLNGVSFVGGRFFAKYLTDARTRVTIYGTDGEKQRDVKLPGLGTASGFSGRSDDTETYYSFSSFAVQPSVYRYDIETGTSELLRRAKVDFDPDAYVTKQVFYESKDGTRVPMFIAHRADLKLDGSQPTLLYGYGGFSIPLTPYFSISRLAWMEMGGVFALANLRGGGEYGEEWHRAGIKTKKQNVFDDFIAASEYLIAEGYTNSSKLAIQGGSNGGLLVGACMTQRPDLFAACLPAVGVMDMLRFHLFTAGRFWVDDYGSIENEEEFQALFAYSPYHNLKPGTEYPATLVTTADTDDRVVPSHSFKFIARLQKVQAGSDPVLIRIETKAGHGAGKPTSKVIEEIADKWAFLVHNLDMKLSTPTE